MSQLFEQLGRGIAQMNRHIQRAERPGVGQGRVPGQINRVALGGAGEIDHRLSKCQLPLRGAETFLRLPGVERQVQCTRIGVANVFAGHPHDAPRHIERITAAVDHPRQPIERGVRVRSTYRLMQRRDLVVEDVPALVEASHAAGDHLRDGRRRDLLARRHPGRQFEKIQRPAGIAVGAACEQMRGLLRQAQPTLAKPLHGLLEGTRQDARDVLRLQGMKQIDPCTREQRIVQREGRILGRGPDKRQGAVFDMRQEGVLLGLVESVHLVDEEQCGALFQIAHRSRRDDRVADLLHAREDGGETEEMGTRDPRDEARERGLTRAGRPPEDHRVELSRLDRPTQRLARRKQVLLTEESVQCCRSHPFGEWRISHSEPRPKR